MPNEQSQPDGPVAKLTREIVVQKLADLDAKDRALTAALVAMYETKGYGLGLPKTPVRDLEPTRQQRIKALLNGAGDALVKDVGRAAAPTEGDLYEQREDVRASMRLLMAAQDDLVAVAAVEWANAHRTEWLSIAKDWVLTIAGAVAAIERCEERASAFVKRAPSAEIELPLAMYVAGNSDIHIPTTNLPGVLKAAVAAGLVTEAELRKARHERP